MTDRRIHLEDLPKRRLVEIAREAIEQAELHAQASEAWRRVAHDAIAEARPRAIAHALRPAEVTWAAEQLLRALPADPDAATHRAVLIDHAIHPNYGIRHQEAS